MRILLTIQIPFIRDAVGTPHTDPLWVKDLQVNSLFLEELVVCAPENQGAIPEGWCPVGKNNVRFVTLPSPQSLLAAFQAAPATRRILAGQFPLVDAVQLNVAGWPIPLGAVALGPALRSGKPIITVVESAPWRESASIVGKIKGWFLEVLARRCVARSDLAFFTHQGYLDTLAPASFRGTSRALVVPATWIDEDLVIPETQAASRRAGPPGTLKVLFAGRLTEPKGTRTVADLIGRLQPEDGIRIDIIGEGPDRSLLEAAVTAAPRVSSLLAPVAYVPDFFHLLDGYDLVLVPTLSDEQPRVIFDAYARGVPVAASRTVGNFQIVQEKETGWMFPPGDGSGLRELLLDLVQHPEARLACGRKAASVASTMTHRRMHETRVKQIQRVLNLS